MNEQTSFTHHALALLMVLSFWVRVYIHGDSEEVRSEVRLGARMPSDHSRGLSNRLETSAAVLKSPPGLPWWFSGKQSPCQCRRHRFDAWSGKNPHAEGQLSP